MQSDNDKSSNEANATIALFQGNTARVVLPGQRVLNAGTTSCALVVALYQGETSVSCYHWPFLIDLDEYIDTFMELARGKTLRKVVIITNGIRGDSDERCRIANSTTIRTRVNCHVEYYTLTSTRDLDPCIEIQDDGEPSIQAENRLFRNML